MTHSIRRYDDDLTAYHDQPSCIYEWEPTTSKWTAAGGSHPSLTTAELIAELRNWHNDLRSTPDLSSKALANEFIREGEAALDKAELRSNDEPPSP